ncbi:23S rRNA (cytidine1920-2'-O)/16S rRNA (cytidine1409-2'-O)-methyltransferase [Maridesulfovibrio ferrireducens]|uniref:23S rRNA (Cytidine1920-2'-O)/16S rRNA (Cytidine1409-2'-O)-methyltransferase n=1 Tax=Maridesulfovibrio ferrireducens TaxID=246191 RepID=A0A1G9HZN8_9BACT|nr:TlyA family RNA methyltransferase [Maridesulfovibrio ferrireducens]SDL18023.1 23S rRNA (cytidine1920-2'-O)/16S rRNA (cytidine1409-2'-O)-methyltransferase [Maridesulfovibrio ferrireducens]
MAKKERADQMLFSQGLSESREQAKRLIMAGQAHFLQNGQKLPITKPGMQLDPDLEIVVKDKDRFVSRGGYKLLTAIEELGLDPKGKVALDAGASTGGFTDCMLQFGALKVYAADVGYGQLHWKLQKDERVINLERVNLRHAEKDLIPEEVDLVVCDVSFISLTKVLPALVRFLKNTGEIVCLIKPQFEVGPGQTDKGIVRDESLRQQAVDMIINFAASELHLILKGLVPSSIKGPKGNQEYLAYFIK